MQVDQGLLEPLREETNSLRSLASIQDAKQAHVLVRTDTVRVWHEVERADGGSVEAHELGEVVVLQVVLRIVGFVSHQVEVRDQRSCCRHGVLEIEFGLKGSSESRSMESTEWH
jgi:hypothetical protein